MSSRKVYNYYRPRIQIPIDTMSSSPGEWMLYCLPVDIAEALLRIIPYLERDITYIGEIQGDKTFLGPTESEMQYVKDLVGEGTVALMSGCNIDELIEQIELLVGIQAQMAQCVCDLSQLNSQVVGRLPELGGYVDEELVTYKEPGDVEGNPTDPATDQARCELAQAVWYYMYQMHTEQLLPFANSTADTLTAALVAASAFSYIAGFVGIPVTVLSGIVSAVITWGVDGAISDAVNWMLGTKDEIICIYYKNFPDFAAAAAEVKAFIDSQAEPSFLEKQLYKVTFGSSWHMTWVCQDQQDNGTWNDYLIPGQCDDCDPTPPGCYSVGPCVLADWDNGTDTCINGYAVHTGGISRWTKETFSIPSGGASMRVGWVPRTDGSSGSPNCRLGAYRVSDGAWYAEHTTPARPKDVLVEETFTLSTQVWGVDAQLAVQQQGWWAEIKYVCIDPL